jgi:hypothetical protein
LKQGKFDSILETTAANAPEDSEEIAVSAPPKTMIAIDQLFAAVDKPQHQSLVT